VDQSLLSAKKVDAMMRTHFHCTSGRLAYLLYPTHFQEGEPPSMFNVTITNNYIYGFMIDSSNELFEPGHTYQFQNWGSHRIHVPGMGDINVIDIADKKLNEYTNDKIPWTKSTWGGLIRYRGLDAYFRYEGQGHLTIVIDAVGSIAVHFDQGGMLVMVEDMTIN
jgi:hypothetical protein